MRLSINNIRLLFVALSIIVVPVACGSEGSADTSTQDTLPGIDVLTTIYPVTYFTQRIGGDLVNVTSLMKPGVTAHDYEPAPSDVIDLVEADLVVYNHASFEVWVSDALDATASGSRMVVEAAEVDPDGAGNIDPHVWLHPAKAMGMVERIRDGLITAEPTGASIFRANTDELIAELAALRDQMRDELGHCADSVIVVSHLAYGHLADALNIRQIGLSGLSAESETGARRVAEVIDEMKRLDLRVIMQEPLSNSDLAETVAREANAQILTLHPLEALTEEEQRAGDDYFTVMQDNIQALSWALGCRIS
jgi:zinc transport system substrate-binding protein